MSTVEKVLQLGAKRMGLDTANATTKSACLDYANLLSTEIFSLTKWRFLFKSESFYTTVTMAITGASTSFTAGETITGGTSGETAVVDEYDSDASVLYIRSVSGAFTDGETVTGSSSLAEATVSSTTGTDAYDLASDFVIPLSFRDTTSSRVLGWVSVEDYDLDDPSHTFVGDPRAALILTVNADTGRWQVVFEPAPSASGGGDGHLIRYRYYGEIAELTSANYTQDMGLWVPRYLQKAYVHGIPALFLEEKGALTAAKREREHFADAISRALTLNNWQGEEPDAKLGELADLRADYGEGISIIAIAPS